MADSRPYHAAARTARRLIIALCALVAVRGTGLAATVERGATASQGPLAGARVSASPRISEPPGGAAVAAATRPSGKEPAQPAAPGPSTSHESTPRWVARLSPGQWYEIPDTAPSRIGTPFPDQRGRQASRLAYSGSTLRKSGSYLFLFGGGHADYSGNEIHAIRLNAEKPAWELLSPATPFAQIPWKGSERGASHYADGRPASRHTYWQPIFVDSLDRMFLFLSMVVWGNSSGSFSNVDAFRFSDRAWDPKDTWAPPPVFPPAATGPWTVKHPETEDVYVAIYSKVLKWTRSTGRWSFQIRGSSWEHDRGIAAIDPVRNRILKLGTWNRGRTVVPYVIPLDRTDTMTFVDLAGPYANVIAGASTGTVGQAGFVYNPDLDKFMYYPDDGATYTIDPETWRVDRYPVSGQAPPAGIRYAADNGSGIYGRFQYVPELHGVVYMPAWTKNLYFLKTGDPRDGSSASAATRSRP